MDADRERASQSSRRRRPYSAAVRASAVAALEEGLAAGRSVTGLAREMRLPVTTAQRWLAEAHGAFRAVTIASLPPAAPTAAGVVVQTARGHRIEGLDVAGAIAVVRALESAG